MTERWPYVGDGEVLRHVRDRHGVVWRVVRDGGVATCADATSVISVGIAELARSRGPLEDVASPSPLPVDRSLPAVGYELADFSPGSSHLHGCAADVDSSRPCDSGCIHALFDVAQDLDRRVAAQRAVIDRRGPRGGFGPTGDLTGLPWSNPIGRGLVEVRGAGATSVWAENQRVIAHESETPPRGHDEDGDCCRRARLGIPQKSELCLCMEPRPAVAEDQLVPVGAYRRCLGCRKLIEP